MNAINEINQKIDEIENRLKNGQELTVEQGKELTKISYGIFKDRSPEAQAMRERIAEIRDWNLRIRTFNYIDDLEKRYDEIEKEYLSSETSPERKAELVEESEKVAKSLQILQR
jgi:uncharacterized coiled-coil DUF342 family protein